MYNSNNHHHHDPSYASNNYYTSSSSSRYASASARHADDMNMSPRIDKCFPGPLRIPPAPRLLASSSSPTPTSSSSSPYSSDNSPPSYRSASPLPWTGKLPPIRHLAPSPRDNLPHLSSVRWDHHDDDWKSSSSRYSSSSSCNPHDDHKQYKGVAHQSYYPTPEVTVSRDHTSHYEYSQRSPSENTFQRRGSISNSSPDSAYCDPAQYQKLKFGVRKGTRFYCTYVSPVTGERCAAWDQGWTVYATLNRHAESDHAHEELALIARGGLTYNEAQIVTSREKQERIEENLANTGRCPDCGTVFSSNRKDSLTRHKQTNACEKAQKRGRPPTKFPKKPKGPSIQVLEVESGDEGY